MSDLALLTSIPEVRGAVLSDPAGVLLDSVNEPDGESVAAIVGFVANTLAQAGEQLGLGAVQRISILGEAHGCVVVIEANSIACAMVDSARSLPAVERSLDTSLKGMA